MIKMTEADIYKIIGAIGLLLICAGLLTKKRRRQNILYILGGVSLEVYSVFIQDKIFITLQIIFILAAVFDLTRIARRRKT